MSGRLSFFRLQRKFFVLFPISFLIYFGLNTDLVYLSKFGEEGLVVTDYPFTSQRESHSVPDRDFFATILLILSYFELSRIEFPKLTSYILTEIVTILVVLVDQFCFYMHQPIKPWPFEKVILWPSLSLHFHMVLESLRQVISLKKMVVLSAKFTILISWSPICIPLILISTLMRLASTSAAILYYSMNSRRPWRTHRG